MTGLGISADPRGREGVPWVALILGLAAFAVLIGLGTWQMQRLHWKEGLLSAIDTRTHSAPVTLAQAEARFGRSGDIDYTPVTVRGTFRHEGERHFLATWQGQSGFFVYTPLQLDDRRVVFINRGFVPYDLKDPAKRPQGQFAGPVTITGLARDPLAEKPSWVVPDNQLGKNVFYWKDRDAMARSAGIATGVVPIFIDADATANPGGYPIGGVTLIDQPNNHLQYALTWYGLAAALAAVGGMALLRRRAARQGADT